jgi:hypothetical protein
MANKFKPTHPSVHEKMRATALKDPALRAEYESFRIQYELAARMKKLREKIRLTQEAVAELMSTKTPMISRLESINSKHSPSIGTLCKYANALGYTLKIDLVPLKSKNKSKSRAEHREDRS